MRKLLALAAMALMLTSTASLAHFPEGQIFGAWQWPSNQLPNLDGDISEWNVLPAELWIDIFQTEVAEGDIGREIDTANKWNGQYNVPHVHGSYESMLADPDVDVIYNATPNHLHAKWTILAAEAGKHVLCEKPLASHVGEVMAMLDACRRNKVCLIEAFMWRCHPMAKQLHERVKDGTIGDVALIESSHAFNWGPWQADNCRAKAEQSGGSIMDVGTYAVCGARLVAGAARAGTRLTKTGDYCSLPCCFKCSQWRSKFCCSSPWHRLAAWR